MSSFLCVAEEEITGFERITEVSRGIYIIEKLHPNSISATWCKDPQYPHKHSTLDVCYTKVAWNNGGSRGSSPCKVGGAISWCNIPGGARPGSGCVSPPVCSIGIKETTIHYIRGLCLFSLRGPPLHVCEYDHSTPMHGLKIFFELLWHF